MAVGDEAAVAGYPLVPDTGEEGRVRWGARELNRTRDFIAQVAGRIPSNKNAARAASGITISASDPTGGENGDIHFKVV